MKKAFSGSSAVERMECDRIAKSVYICKCAGSHSAVRCEKRFGCQKSKENVAE